MRKLILKLLNISWLTGVLFFVVLLCKDLPDGIKDEKLNRAYYSQVPIRQENKPCGQFDNSGIIKIAGKPAVLIYDASGPLLYADYPKTNNPQVYDYDKWQAYAVAERARRAAKGEYAPAYAR